MAERAGAGRTSPIEVVSPIELVAGSARIALPAPDGVPLMGYGARTSPSSGRAGPLAARALFLRTGGSELLLISLDLCLILPTQAALIRAILAHRINVSEASVLVSCTHTHSAPDTALDRTGQAPPHLAPIFDAAIDAGVEAARAARPAQLRWLEASARIGRNRCRTDGPHDPRVGVLEIESPGGVRIATAFVHGCHPTVLGHDNLAISGDWPGVTCAEIEARTGAPALFVLSAHADVDPRTRGLMDLAIPGQSVGASVEAARILGLEVAAAVLDAGRDGETPFCRGPVGVAVAQVELDLQLGALDPDAVEAQLAARRRDLAARLGVDPADFPRLSALDALAFERARTLGPRDARSLISATRLYLRDKTAPFYASTEPGHPRRASVPITVARIDRAMLLGLPLEATTRVGLDWRERMADYPFSAVASIMNGWLRYLPHADDLAHPEAHLHYEALSCIFAPGTAEQILRAGARLAESL